MNRFQETFETWNKIASLYQDKFMYLDCYNESYDFVCHRLAKSKSKILEIACGPGNITRYLLTKRPDFDIYGIDIAPNMIALAQVNNPTAHFEIMDCRDIGLLKAKYDAIICGFCLPYLPAIDCDKLISDAYHLLSKEGLIYLSFVEGEAKQSGFQVGSGGDRVYFYFHRIDQLSQKLTAYQFDILQTFQVVYKKSASETEMHNIIIAIKK